MVMVKSAIIAKTNLFISFYFINSTFTFLYVAKIERKTRLSKGFSLNRQGKPL
jgi:hypothetical protein